MIRDWAEEFFVWLTSLDTSFAFLLSLPFVVWSCQFALRAFEATPGKPLLELTSKSNRSKPPPSVQL